MIKLNLRRGNSTVWFGRPTWSEMPPSGTAVCLLVHGYNVVAADGAYAEIEERIRPWYGQVGGVWWPGSEISLAFWLAARRAEKAGKLLAAELAKLPGIVWDLEGHSLGCKVVLEAVKAGAPVRNVVLVGAAVDNEALDVDNGAYGQAVVGLNRCVVAHSRRDGVLANVYPLARMDRALGCTGPTGRIARNVVVMDVTDEVGDHGAYKRSPAVYAAWKHALEV